MLLTKVTVHKYKSFLKEQSFVVEPGVTRIVGKNESGKTALLEAIAKSNYFESRENFTFNKDLDYPRSELVGVRLQNPYAITCDYELSEEEIVRIEEEFKVDILPNHKFSLISLYDNTKKVSGLQTDFNVFKKWIFDRFSIDKSTAKSIRGATTFESLESIVNLNADNDGQVKQLQIKLNEIKKGASDWSDVLAGYIYFKYIQGNIPKFWYFDDYYTLPARVNLADLTNARATTNLTVEEINIVKALLDLSGLNISDIQSENEFEMFTAQLEATSNAITDKMFEYWSSNKNLAIEFKIEHNSNNRYLNIRIRNTNHRVSLPLKNRSKGFIWFFSFLVWFSKIQGNSNNYILLLDEPGLNLHASAQRDLLRYIEQELSPNYQIIYTTHSPFMIDSLKLNEVRTVYDTQDSKIGSIISDALEEKDSDTLFPLQAALGYTIAQNLYVSPKNLLVEGISDLVYLNHFSSVLKSLNREGLSEDITIVPVGGADKIATFISLLRGNHLSIVCLLDTFNEQKAEARLNRLIDDQIISRQNILYYDRVVNFQHADIEDLFEKGEYIKLYNGCFKANILEDNLDADRPIMKQLKQLNNNKSFNHYMPANYMMQHIHEIPFSDKTLNRFEQLFKMINEIC